MEKKNEKSKIVVSKRSYCRDGQNFLSKSPVKTSQKFSKNWPKVHTFFLIFYNILSLQL